MNAQAQRFPLEWPSDQPRTPENRRVDGPYRVTQAQAQQDLLDELRRMKAQHVVLSTNVPIRRDGMPYSRGYRLDDTGVAVYWTRDGRDYCVACDTYVELRSNIRAVGLAIHHLRRLEHAAPMFAERAFSGFARLAPNAGGDGARPWQDVLELDPLRQAINPQVIERVYRQLARARHPDHGGSADEMAELNRARNEALAALGAL